MPIESEQYGAVCVLGVRGDLEGDETEALRRAAEQAIDGKHLVEFVVDLSQCGFVDSEGLEALLWLKRRAEELFGSLKLAGCDENVAKILEMTRLAAQFDAHADLAGAVRNMA